MTEHNYKCPFCENTNCVPDNRPLLSYNGVTYSWVKCIACELVFLVPKLRSIDLQSLYAVAYHEAFYFKNDSIFGANKMLLKKLGKKKLLDYGCGDGSFLSSLLNEGYELTGVEYDEKLVERLRKDNQQINFQTTAQFFLSAADFEIIHLGDVLEHHNAPHELMKNLKTRLSKDGYIYAEGPLETNPNLAFFVMRLSTLIRNVLKSRQVIFDKPYHVWMANKKNQLLFFEDLGLRTIHFAISEKGYPYVNGWKDVHSLKDAFQWMVANCSKAVSFLIPGWGNRFCYIGQVI